MIVRTGVSGGSLVLCRFGPVRRRSVRGGGYINALWPGSSICADHGRSWPPIAAAGLVTGSFRLGGLLGTAGQVTAYATVVLAFGTIGLAAGAVGTYAELREANQQQAGQLARQKVEGLAQVKVERFSGPGEMLRVEVHNGSERAITNVYVWADARGVRGHYAAGVPVEDARARRIANVPLDGGLFR